MTQQSIEMQSCSDRYPTISSGRSYEWSPNTQQSIYLKMVVDWEMVVESRMGRKKQAQRN